MNDFFSPLSESLNASNFEDYAISNYGHCNKCNIRDFHKDLNRFKYLNSLLGRYPKRKKVKERLILNHLIVIYNLFGILPSNRMIFYIVDKNLWEYLIPFLNFLTYFPERSIEGILGNQEIYKKLESEKPQ